MLDLFVYPEWDEFYLVVCNHCNQILRPHALDEHIRYRHQTTSINTAAAATTITPIAAGAVTTTITTNNNNNNNINTNTTPITHTTVKPVNPTVKSVNSSTIVKPVNSNVRQSVNHSNNVSTPKPINNATTSLALSTQAPHPHYTTTAAAGIPISRFVPVQGQGPLLVTATQAPTTATRPATKRLNGCSSVRPFKAKMPYSNPRPTATVVATTTTTAQQSNAPPKNHQALPQLVQPKVAVLPSMPSPQPQLHMQLQSSHQQLHSQQHRYLNNDNNSTIQQGANQQQPLLLQNQLHYQLQLQQPEQIQNHHHQLMNHQQSMPQQQSQLLDDQQQQYDQQTCPQLDWGGIGFLSFHPRPAAMCSFNQYKRKLYSLPIKTNRRWQNTYDTLTDAFLPKDSNQECQSFEM